MTDANDSKFAKKDAEDNDNLDQSEVVRDSESPGEPELAADDLADDNEVASQTGNEVTESLARPQLQQDKNPEYVPVPDWTAAPTWGSDEATPSESAESSEPPISPGIPPTPSVPPKMPSGAHLPPSAAPTTAFVQQPGPGMNFNQANPPATVPENPYSRNRIAHNATAPIAPSGETNTQESQPMWKSPLAQAPSEKVPPQIGGSGVAGAPQPESVSTPPTPTSEEEVEAPAVPIPGMQAAGVVTPQEPPKKQKRSVGLGTLAALMLVAAIGAGGVTGVVLSGQQNSVGESISALGEAPAKRSGLTEPGDVSEVAKSVLPTVVSIYVASANEGGTGSGSIISSDGHVLTNNHVVELAKDGGKIEVLLNDGSIYEADLVAGDVETDIAVIKIRDVKDLPVVTFGDSDEVVVGESVLAVGAPHGLTATVTAGIVSALHRPVRIGADDGAEVFIDAIQTDASINPGNSGGPLVNMQGQLIGVNSIIYSETQGSIGLGFSIPANQASRYADQLIKKGKIDHPRIGVRLDQRYPGPGALIAKVEPDSPAEKAGLSSGDLVVQVGDRRIGETDAIIAAIRALDFGETVTLKVMNPESKETREVQVTLPEQ
ncbi:trypsin-like peptidase domain-containing protein [Corynebacterium freiburgense]|uniref:trypsin-like peptidase domain-containing protein n=1 Tax=Corynebacterium freiburgense TaxID=556548 RepID=UPI0003FCA9C0|nr:trypsin-like peptidase domain-containing protein [Corynebacterium freiburgense]WJZ02087.1 Putative serine protease HhoB precursor [Corynebacterium freiburgense]